MDVENAIVQGTEMLAPLLENNWSLFVGIVIAVLAFKFLNAGLQLISTVIVIAIVISVLTHMGVMPPMDGLFDGLKEVLGNIPIDAGDVVEATGNAVKDVTTALS